MNPSYYFREFIRYLKTAKSAVFTSVIVIAIAVLLLGIYLTISINSVKLLKLIRDKVEIDAYLTDGLSQGDISRLISEIKTIGGVKNVTYISKEDAAKFFAEDFGEDILDVFDYNPLPASLKISLYDEYKTIDRIEKIKSEIQKLRGIDDIVYAHKNLEIIERNARSLVFLNLSLLVVIAFSSVFLAGNTIRLMIEAKKETINIMKLIGASKETIRTPFIMEGLFQGFTGSLLAVLILHLFLSYFYSTYTNTDFSFSVVDTKFIILLIVFGSLLGVIGSAFSIRKHLKFS
ncbi:MAG: ABC transporter permease [Ignavibacteria bacterium]|nr:ABC transporter permease [Ignavibacteria bacterium]